MGKRGPRPLPSAIKHARGTYRTDRAAANEPTPTGRPSCPKWLSPDAAKEFRRLVKQLSEMQLIGSIDQNALARYASTWVRWRQAIQMIERGGEVTVLKDSDGKVKYVQQSPFSTIARQLSDQLGRLEGEFGMTPSSRSRIEVAPAPPPAEPAGKGRFFPSGPAMRIAQ